MGTFKMGKIVLGRLFKKPATLMYPVVPREWTARTRGHIDIDVDACIKCGICAKKCPTNAITVSRDDSTWEIQRMQCIQCGCCVEVCPKKCLSMAPEYTTPTTEKVIDTFDIPVAAKPAAGGAGGGEEKLNCNKDECVFCGLCAKTCPVSALTVDRAEKKWEVDEAACVKCGACVDKCPKKCLEISAAGGAAPAAGGDGLECNKDECVFCGLCAKTCPVEALTVDRAEKKWEVDKDTCVQCGACVDKCPKKCLSL